MQQAGGITAEAAVAENEIRGGHLSLYRPVPAAAQGAANGSATLTRPRGSSRVAKGDGL